MALFTVSFIGGPITFTDNVLVSRSGTFYGLTSNAQNVGVLLNNLEHAYSGDLDMVLSAPEPTKNLLFWSDVGDEDTLDGTYTIADYGGRLLLPTYAPTPNDSSRPADYGELETAESFGLLPGSLSRATSNGTATFASVFNDSAGNGTWTVRIRDDGVGDTGSLAGIGLSMTTLTDDVKINGTAGNDIFLLAAITATSGVYKLNGLNSVTYSGVSLFTIDGGNGDDQITGSAGTDIIVGGVGRDTMKGGLGNDTYYVDNAADVIGEGQNEGASDQIRTSVNYTLAAGIYVETIAVLDNDSTTAINLVGNEIAQLLRGNDGANILNGGGSADAMEGRGGNDRYIVDNIGDKIIEVAGGGTADRVQTSVSYVLTSNAEVELLTTNNTAATNVLNLVGNTFAQTIQGNAGANILNGGGGKDILQGFGGNDKYFVDSASDVVLEAAGGGSDRISTSVSYVLAGNSEIELFTTTNTAGLDAINMTGNLFAQTIQGNAGANLMNGGAGNDVLQGFGGQDGFLFNTALGPNNIDRIADFSVVDDTIRLENTIFASLASTGVLTSEKFAANLTGAATDALDRIIYETDTGKLFYDADGLGGTAGVQFAVITANLGLTNADFLVV